MKLAAAHTRATPCTGRQPEVYPYEERRAADDHNQNLDHGDTEAQRRRGVSEAPVTSLATLTFEKTSLPSLPNAVFSVPPYYYPKLSCFLGKIIQAIYPQSAQIPSLTIRKWREIFFTTKARRFTKRKESVALCDLGGRSVALGMHAS